MCPKGFYPFVYVSFVVCIDLPMVRAQWDSIKRRVLESLMIIVEINENAMGY